MVCSGWTTPSAGAATWFAFNICNRPGQSSSGRHGTSYTAYDPIQHPVCAPARTQPCISLVAPCSKPPRATATVRCPGGTPWSKDPHPSVVLCRLPGLYSRYLLHASISSPTLLRRALRGAWAAPRRLHPCTLHRRVHLHAHAHARGMIYSGSILDHSHSESATTGRLFDDV